MFFSYGRITVTTYADCRQGKTTLRVRVGSFYLTAAYVCLKYIESSDVHVKNDRRVMTNELFKRTSAEFYVEMRCNSLWTLRTSIAFQ
jgi:hypothetical protein